MQLYLIRHAESENNARMPHQRTEDPPLTAVGRLQAQHLSTWIKTLKIDTLICSPVRRSIETTRYITAVTGLHVQVWADVFEEGGIYRGYGPEAIAGGPGLADADIIGHFHEHAGSTLDPSIGEDGWWNRDRESADEAVVRATAVSKRLIETFGDSGQTVVAVTHADFKRKLLTQMLGQYVDASSLGMLRNTGITKVSFAGERWQLDWFNSVTHLPAKLITGNAW